MTSHKRKFKSYYVVWKLEEENDDLTQEEMFKSYYVVWKPWKSGTKQTTTLCLNRTM